MNILLYGAGATGLGYASFILEAGEKVDIMATAETSKKLKETGILRTGKLGDYHALPGSFAVYTSISDINWKIYDVILVATKTILNEEVIKNISTMRLKTAKIILLQNGWGMNRLFEKVFSQSQIINAYIYCGFTRPEKNHSHITAYGGPTFFGNIFSPDRDGTITALCELITTGGLPCEYTSDITTKMWSKMLYNCTTNPLSFIFDVKNGQLGSSRHMREIINGIVEEIFMVLSKTAFKTNWNTAAEYLDYFYNELLPLSKDHRSSMLQDKRTGKHTEIDHFNGAVIDLARHCKVACPHNEITYKMVKFIEQLKFSADDVMRSQRQSQLSLYSNVKHANYNISCP